MNNVVYKKKEDIYHHINYGELIVLKEFKKKDLLYFKSLLII